MKDMNKIKRIPQMKAFPRNQKGMALIMVMVVLLVLTMVGLSSTESSNFQSLMVRNNQFRLEAFNTSFSEIESQLEAFRTQAGKNTLFSAIDNGLINSKGVDTNGLSVPTMNLSNNDPSFTKEVSLEKSSGCPIFNESVGGFKKCHIMELDSNSEYTGTNIGSDQVQQFSFYSF